MQTPILCVFDDGEGLRIFRFVHGEAEAETGIFSMGCLEYPDTAGILSSTSYFRISDSPYKSDERKFFLSLRPICEVLYYLFLKHGLCEQSLKSGCGDFSQAVEMAGEAESTAVQLPQLP